MSRPLAVVIAPDSYKGSLSSVEVAAAFARGWARARPDDRIALVPLADGGEGTLAALEAAGGWTRETAVVADPLGRPVRAAWLRSLDGRRAAVEMAETSGLSRVRPDERDPVGATSRGLGELLLAAARTGADELLVGIGGSATTDGGRGMLEALGMRATGDALDLDGLAPELRAVAVRVACDVTNPLLGERGAAAVYAPQKGASPGEVAELERRLARFADRLEGAAGRRVRDEPGSGAAGGVGFAFLALAAAGAFGSFALEPGVELLSGAVGLPERIAAADLVLTGEGRIDAQTAYGKTALGVARLAAAAGVPCVAIGGSVEPEGIAALAAVGARAVATGSAPISLEAARTAGAGPLEAAAERLARDATLPAMEPTLDPARDPGR